MRSIEWKDVTGTEGCWYHRRGTVVIDAGRGTVTIDLCVPPEAGPSLTIQFTKTVPATRLGTIRLRATRRQDTCRYESLSAATTDKQMNAVLMNYHRFPGTINYHIRVLLNHEARHIEQAMSDQAMSDLAIDARRRAEEEASRENRRRDARSKALAETVPDHLTDFAKPGPVSRSGKGGVRTAHIARSPRRTKRTKLAKATKRTKKRHR